MTLQSFCLTARTKVLSLCLFFLFFFGLNTTFSQCVNFGTAANNDYDCDGIINSIDIFTAKGQLQITGLNLNSYALSSATTNTFKLQGSKDDMVWTDLSGALSSIATTGTFLLPNTLKPAESFKYFRIIGVAGISGNGGVANANLVLHPKTIISLYPKISCLDDFDGDQKPNHLDLDADGDGCADAIEAGSSKTATSTSSFPTGTDFNSNGLLNSYESGTTGTVNYSSTYASYALINAINSCTDTDRDGVRDVIDLDDDNDGVLDSIENGPFGCIASPSSIVNVFAQFYYFNKGKTSI